MKYVLDTDHISIVQRRAGTDYAKLSRRIEQEHPDEVAYSIVSLHEQTVGSHAFINNARSPKELVRGYRMLSNVFETFTHRRILAFDEVAGAIFDDLTARRVRIGTMDRRIAAIALAHDLTLLTRNVADFGKIPELRTEDWTR